MHKCASPSPSCDLLHAAVNPNPVAHTTRNGTIIVMGRALNITVATVIAGQVNT